MEILIRNLNDFVQLVPTEQVPAEHPCPGDTRFTVRVQMGGFSADNWAWVSAAELKRFGEQLLKLEERRQGTARLESISPGQLILQIRSIDRSGHVSAIGQIERRHYMGNNLLHSLVEFAIEFCPGQLPELVKEFRALAQVNPSGVSMPD